MQGAGNDFVVLNAITQDFSQFTRAHWRRLAHRQWGVGADQILLVAKPVGDADFRYRIFNADGGEVEQCGNGSRCFARYVRDQGLTDKDALRVEVMGGIINLSYGPNGQVTVDMGAPIFALDAIPLLVAQASSSQQQGEETLYGVSLGNVTRWVSVLSMGNPHAVQVVDDLTDAAQAPVLREGPLLQAHPAFPNQVNVGYMQVMDRQHIAIRVFERGVGETLSCGTGACAAAVTGIRRGLLNSPVRVSTYGGDLMIAWEPGQSVWMTGPAQTVFTGEIDMDVLM